MSKDTIFTKELAEASFGKNKSILSVDGKEYMLVKMKSSRVIGGFFYSTYKAVEINSKTKDGKINFSTIRIIDRIVDQKITVLK